MIENPFCSVIVLNYNGKIHLKDCLASLAKQSYQNYETILVDNASQDDSIDFVKKNFPFVKIIENDQNSGTAGGFNFGAKFARHEYMLFLANDVEVEPNLLEEMMRTIRLEPSIAICGAKEFKFNERNTISCFGLMLDIYGFPYVIGHNKKDNGQYDTIKDAIPTGTCLLIKRHVFEEIGGFDNEYFSLSDEVDLCWRAKLAGYRILVTPYTKLYHKVSATLGKSKRSRLRYMSERNIMRMLLKNYSALTLIKVLPRHFTLLLTEMLFYLAIGKGNMALAIVRAVLWNGRHFNGTLHLRRKIQKIRVVGDNTIQKEMIRKSIKVDIFRKWKNGESVIR